MGSVNISVTLKFRGGDIIFRYETEVKRDRRRSVRVIQEGKERRQRRGGKEKTAVST
jgi:hypothetical protein